MKKLISTLLSMAILAGSAITVPFTSASAAGEHGLVFDMDLSEYTDGNRVIKNKVDGSANGIEVRMTNNFGKCEDRYPIAGTLESAAGETKYIVTGKNAEQELEDGTVQKQSQSWGYVNLEDAIARPIVAGNTATIETWFRMDYAAGEGGEYIDSAKPDSTQGYHKLFALSNFDIENSWDDGSDSMQVDFAEGRKVRIRYGQAGDPNSYSHWLITKEVHELPEAGQWNHLVVTRKWNPETEKWSGTTYLNGKEFHRMNEDEYEQNQFHLTEQDAYSIQIGNVNRNQEAFGKIIGAIGAFRLYTEELSEADAYANYVKEKVNYEVLQDTLEVISPADGGEIDPNAEELDINFNNFVDLEKVKDKIILEEDYGYGQTFPIPGGVEVTADTQITKTVKLKFGRLFPETSYILNLQGVTSINDKLINTNSISLTTTDGYIAKFDENTTSLNDTGFIFNGYDKGNSTEANEAFRIDENGWLELPPNEVDDGNPWKNTYLGYEFGPGHAPVKVEISAWKIGNTNLSYRVFGGSDTLIRYFTGAASLAEKNWNGTAIYPEGKNEAYIDNHGTFIPVTMFIAMNDDNTITVKYLDYNNDWVGTWTSNEQINETLISRLCMYAISPKLDPAQGTEPVRVEYFKVSSYAAPRIMRQTELANRKVDFYFNTDLDTSTFDTITTVNNAGEAVPASYKYDMDERCLTLTFTDDSVLEGDYKVDFSKVRNGDNEPLLLDAVVSADEKTIGLVSDVSFVDVDTEQEITDIYGVPANGRVRAQLELRNTTGVDTTVTAAMAVYKDGKLYQVVTEKTALPQNQIIPVGVTLNTQDVGLNETEMVNAQLRFFVWDGLDTVLPVLKNVWNVTKDGIGGRL